MIEETSWHVGPGNVNGKDCVIVHAIDGTGKRVTFALTPEDAQAVCYSILETADELIQKRN